MHIYTLRFDTGVEVSLRPTLNKNKTHQFLAARPDSEPIVTHFGFNVPIDVVGGKLPSKATLVVDGKATGNTVVLDKGLTDPPATKPNAKRNPKVTGQLPQPIDFDGAEQTLTIRISQPKDSTANVMIRSARPNEGKVHTSL